ncbi:MULTISPECIES: acyl-CoA dehydrogenase [Thermomonospora]|uniref:Acyl-CoA dehydrogenase domain protein n=1 Tax=Thermomonospora curvata (strain ATCC 19995 / DSM 43183 / JCM 3096 / KCTC 9072 / NBRC 15933 / NCIMB 10081 / Henssen B9) TaxID=471852 RepID=D1A1Q5_THECD|nr:MULTISPECIES: acyl-CoA dehydrogenase [Thermomonospora]ACY97743.1 acyl-CoA dehydrogenase domain protein [Thermomonospora curvata DSM 43183]PKK14041.1 MAG: acyl-CoA dehydrogenase [Thermomonospora sp. CIF 1]
MAIGLTEEHEALAESVRGFAERNISTQVVRTALDADTESRPAFWPALAEQGLLGLHLPEEHGGQGFGLLELAVTLEELGRAAAPGPFLPTVLASAAINACGNAKAKAELLPALADGSKTGALALTAELTGRRDGDALVISGAAEPVLGAALADVIVLPVATDQGEEWVALDAADLTVTAVPSLDKVRRVAKVEAAELTVAADRVLDGLKGRDVQNLAAVLLGAEAAGVASWCVTTAAEYAKVREQFGRPIGQFQGVKHKAARMLIALEQARAAVWDAAVALGDEPGPQVEFAAAVAGTIAPEAAVQTSRDCIQILGGIGFTWEHDAHIYLRRALTLRALLGPAKDWAATVATLALDGHRRPIELELGEDTQPLRERIRAEVAELAAITDRKELNAKMGDEGWTMPHFPKPWGRGAGPVEQILIAQELKAAGVKPPSMVIGAWLVPSLVAYGTEEQKERFLRPTLRGEMVWCQLFSEPGAGSDLASLSMKAERVEGGWKLTGQKIWTSMAQMAEWGFCLARTDPEAPKHEGITYFLVDMKSPGVEVRPLRELTGDALFNEVFLDGVFVPDDCVVGKVNEGWKVARNTLSNERVTLSTGSGLGMGMDDLLKFFQGTELDPVTRVEVGKLVAQGHSIDLLALRTTLKQLNGVEPGAEASVRKLLGVQFSQDVADYCWAAQGAAAATEVPAERSGIVGRAMLFSRAMTIYGGTTEVQLNIIAERLLGLPRDPEPGK